MFIVVLFFVFLWYLKSLYEVLLILLMTAFIVWQDGADTILEKLWIFWYKSEEMKISVEY